MVHKILTLILSLGLWAGALGQIPDFSEKLREEVPEEYKWRIEDVFASVEEWQKEKGRVLEKICEIDAFLKRWQESPQRMLAFFNHLTESEMMMQKLYAYAELRTHMEMANPVFRTLLGEMQPVFGMYYSKVRNLEGDLQKMGEGKFMEYLEAEPKLEPFKGKVIKIIKAAEHTLSPDAAQVVYTMSDVLKVPQEASRALLDVDLPVPEVRLSDGRRVSLNYNTFRQLKGAVNKKDRDLMDKTYYQNLHQFRHLFAILINGAVKGKVIEAELEKYGSALEKRMLSEGLDEEVFRTTLKQVRHHLPLFHRYLKLKKKMSGYKNFTPSDIGVFTLLKQKRKYSYPEACQIISEAVKGLGKEYSESMSRALEDRWIDRYAHKGRRNFGYSYDVPGVHPYVLLNFSGTFKDIHVMIHELGHSMHQWFSNRNVHYEHRMKAGTLAEGIAHFNEQLLIAHMLKKEENPRQRLYILDQSILGITNAIYNMTRMAEFEHAMYTQVKQGKTLTANWLNKTFMDLLKLYYGENQGITQIPPHFKSSWMDIPHLFMNHYVISYANGMIFSLALNDMVTAQGEAGRKKYLQLISSGSSDTPLNLLKRADLDLKSPQTYTLAFTTLKSLISQMEKLLKE